MTDQELFRLYQSAANPTAGLRAVFDAGLESAQTGDDDASDAGEYLASLPNYDTRQQCSG